MDELHVLQRPLGQVGQDAPWTHLDEPVGTKPLQLE
jgi:hypothetical protein